MVSPLNSFFASHYLLLLISKHLQVSKTAYVMEHIDPRYRVLTPASLMSFVTADGDNEDRHRFRKTSATEYYDFCGYNIATNWRRRWQEAEQPQWRELLDNMPSLKTSNLANLVDAINYRLSNFWAVVNHHDRDFRYRVLALKSYKGQQMALNEIGRRFTFGSRKYGAIPTPFHAHMIDLQQRQGSTWKKLPSIDLSHEDGLQHYIIAYGNGAFGSSMKGKEPGPTKKIFRHLCHLARFRNIQVLSWK